ncbi:hypothetical protein BJX63DRAFT_429601 [Aspergillus granulosus]|uniref:Uncharacterized protein n=1 Tax=Aspergillus granulosus TaxID=176169 RepID=A0ABR4HQ03_9EURO
MHTINQFLGMVDWCINCNEYAEPLCYKREHQMFKDIDWDPINYEKSPPKFDAIIAKSQEIHNEGVSPKTVCFSSARHDFAARTPDQSAKHSGLWNSKLFFNDSSDWPRYGVHKKSISPSQLSALECPQDIVDGELHEPTARNSVLTSPAFVKDDWLVGERALHLEGHDHEYCSVSEESQLGSLLSYMDHRAMARGTRATGHRPSVDNLVGVASDNNMTAADKLRLVDEAIIRRTADFKERIRNLKSKLETMTINFEADMGVLENRKIQLQGQISMISTACPIGNRKRQPEGYQDNAGSEASCFSDDSYDPLPSVVKRRRMR